MGLLRDKGKGSEYGIADREAVGDRGDTGAGEGADVAGAAQGASPRVVETPIIAWKNHTLQAGTAGGWSLQSAGGSVRRDDRAVCTAGRFTGSSIIPHDPLDVPRFDCSCGFHAWRDRDRAADRLRVEVELFGRVVVHEAGYRAERQRILGVSIRRCDYCANPPEAIALGGIYDAVPAFSTASGYGYSSPSQRIICSEHSRLRDDEVRVPIQHLSDLLDLPVTVGDAA